MATITQEVGEALQTRPASTWLGRVPGPPDLLWKLRPVFSTWSKAAWNGYVVSPAKESTPALAVVVQELPPCTPIESEAANDNRLPLLELPQEHVPSVAALDAPDGLAAKKEDLASSTQAAGKHDAGNSEVAADTGRKLLAGKENDEINVSETSETRTDGSASKSEVVDSNTCGDDPTTGRAEEVLATQQHDTPATSTADTIEVIDDRGSPANTDSNAVVIQAAGPSTQGQTVSVTAIDFATRKSGVVASSPSPLMKSGSWRGSLREKLRKPKDGLQQNNSVFRRAQCTSVPDEDATIFTEQVRPHVRALLRHKTAGMRNQLDDRTACELVMMDHASSAKRIPVILFTCYRPERQKQIQAALSKPALESVLAKFGYPAVVQVDESLGFRAKATQIANEGAGTDGKGLLVLADISPGATSLTGVTIGIETHKDQDRGSHILGTCGGVVSVSGTSYAISCSHALVEWLEAESDLAKILGDGHNSRIQSDLSSFDFLDTAKWKPRELGKVAAFSSKKEDSDALDFDWLLIAVEDDALLPNKVTEVWTAERDNPNDRMVTVVTSRDALLGLVCAGRSLLDIGPAIYDAVRIDLDYPLNEGDCGAWVFRAGKLFGMVVAGRDNPPTAYVLPANEVFDDISTVMGHCTLELPSSLGKLTRLITGKLTKLINRSAIDPEIAEQGSASNEHRDRTSTDVYAEKRKSDLETGLSSDIWASRERMSSEQPKSALKESESSSPYHPQNWPKRRRWLVTTVATLYTLLPFMASTMVVPALPRDRDVVSQMIFSVFTLGQAFGPLFFTPLTDFCGRWMILQLAFAVFGVANLVSGFVPVGSTNPVLIPIRLVSGIGGTITISICYAISKDCWKPKERVAALASLSAALLLGQAIGPIIGAFITQYASWRWVYWWMAIAAGAFQLVGVFLLPETLPGLVEKRKNHRPDRTTWLGKLRIERQPDYFLRWLKTMWSDTITMLSLQPIFQLTALYMAFSSGLLDLVMSTLPIIFTREEYYHEAIGVAGLNYISVILGFLLGGIVTGMFTLRKEHKPESRIPRMTTGAVSVPTGLFIYGWTAQTHQYWILPNLGLVILSSGVACTNAACQSYLVETYTRHATAAMASSTIVRSIFGFSFPLFVPALYQRLGFGWGNSVLAFVAIAMGFVCIGPLWVFGPKLRASTNWY